ncbi:MAG: YhjD/YihY/BrkB family envelope integrity protein [Rhodopila sp.]
MSGQPIGGLALVFRFGPSRDHARWKTVMLGAAVAMALWMAASVGVSIYVNHLTSYGKFYGSLGTVAVVLL